MKTSCIARIFGSLDQVDPEMTLEKDDDFHTLREDLEKSIIILLNNTGEHYEVTKGVINALGKKKPLLALDITRRLNIQSRRDTAIYDLLNTILDQPVIKIDYDLIYKIIDEISDKELRQNAIFRSIVSIASSTTDEVNQIIKNVLPIISLIDKIESAPLKCNAYGLAYVLINKVKKIHLKVLLNI